ncbi:MAG TPA: hypothetical protein VMM84_09160 [Pyrinomonadaceae bacterium]|nr:hypothetical protein [Pyrinomonadaceae bacterium]
MELAYSIAGRSLLIEALDKESASAIRTLFGGWLFTPIPILIDPPDSSIRIRHGSYPSPIPSDLESFEIANGASCSTDGETFYLAISGSVAVIRSVQPVADIWLYKPSSLDPETQAQIISYGVSAALRRCGVFDVHSGGVVAPDGTTALCIGPSGSGKSTLTLQLLSAGWGYLSDDVILLSGCERGIEARGVRRVFALTQTSLEAAKLASPVMTAPGSTSKLALAPQDYFPDRLTSSSIPGVLLFLKIVKAGTTSFQKLTEYEAMTRLLKQCPWACYDKPVASNYVGVLGTLVKQSAAFGLFLGADLLENPDFTLNLLNTIIEKSK